MLTQSTSPERLALRAVRAFSLTAEAALRYFAVVGAHGDDRFDGKLPLMCSDYAEHIAQDVLSESNSRHAFLEGLLPALGWLKQFDRDHLHRVTRSSVPTDSDIEALIGDVQVALATAV